MTIKNYALIKDNNIVNVVVFDDSSTELLNFSKEIHDVDDIIIADNNCVIGGTYDGKKFWLPQPYPSWIKNENTNEWEAPIPYPEIQIGSDELYTWDENTMSWLLLPPIN
jgi:hypothetical protein